MSEFISGAELAYWANIRHVVTRELATAAPLGHTAPTAAKPSVCYVMIIIMLLMTILLSSVWLPVSVAHFAVSLQSKQLGFDALQY